VCFAGGERKSQGRGEAGFSGVWLAWPYGPNIGRTAERGTIAQTAARSALTDTSDIFFRLLSA
jgi:hypothetical protein